MTSYSESSAINNSAFNYLDLSKGGSPQRFKDYLDGKIKSDDTKYYREGSLVHLALLEAHKLVVADIIRPIDSITGVVDDVFESVMQATDEFTEVGELADYEQEINTAMTNKAYQTNWLLATRLAKVLELGKEYFKFLKRCTTETVLTTKEYALILACAASVRVDRFAKKLMLDSELGKGMEALNEQEIYFNISLPSEIKIPCKAKLDRLLLNHARKTFAVVDLKTTGKSVLDFPKSFFEYDYDRQIAFYAKAAKSLYPDYSLSGCYFVVVEKQGEFRTRAFTVDRKTIKHGLDKINKLLATYATCLSTGSFVYEPGYDDFYVIDLSMDRETALQEMGIDPYRQFYMGRKQTHKEEKEKQIK
jgi:hypothetical protein